MTLTAITEDLQVFRPQAQIDAGAAELAVAREMRSIEAQEPLFCPHCYHALGELVPVRYRHCTDRSCHFYHLVGESSDSQCISYKPETERHLNAKAAIAESLKREREHRFVEMIVSVDRYRLQGEDVRDRKPDILVVYANGTKEAHEVQVSAISETELSQRTIDLSVQHGCDRVVWYLYGKAYNYLNRKWLSDNSVEHYRLTFKREEQGTYPHWELAPTPEEPKRKEPSEDRACKRSQGGHAAVDLHEFRASRNAAEAAERQRTATVAKSEEIDLYRWFLYAFQCPSAPFELKPAQRIVAPQKWLAYQRPQVIQSLAYLEGTEPKPHPRHHTGALQAELQILRAKFS